MARSPRSFEPGLPLHIHQRGNNRADCFRAIEDYGAYLHWLGEYAHQYGCAIHAYVLMTNHVHLLATPRDDLSASAMMQSLGRKYVAYFNRKHCRTGTLWEGRFRSHLVDSDDYLLTLYRYIELNPVRARMVDEASQYRWSSYRHNALGHVDPRLRAHEVFNRLGRDASSRREAYRTLVEQGLDVVVVEAVRACLRSGERFGAPREKVAALEKELAAEKIVTTLTLI